MKQCLYCAEEIQDGLYALCWSMIDSIVEEADNFQI